MNQTNFITEQIINRWYNKLCSSDKIPETVKRQIEVLHKQRKLFDINEITKIIENFTDIDNDKHK